MTAFKQAEKTVHGLLKDLPPLSNSTKETLVNLWPWLAIIFGLLQLAAAYWLWQLTRVVDALNAYVNTLSLYTTGQTAGLSSLDKTLIYAGVLVLVIDAVILLMAYPHLVKRARKGWDLLFLGALLNLAYSFLAIFIDGRGFGSFIFSLLGSAIGFYLLFQVREKYGHHKKA